METIKKVYAEDIQYIQTHLPEHRIYEQLAEECCELAQAALKMSRYLQRRDRVGLAKDDIEAKLDEEITDVFLCLDTLKLPPKVDMKIAGYKANRWRTRIEDMTAGYEEAYSNE